jgi:hypothetical protein
MNLFKVSYVTTLPKIGNAPSVSIFGDIDEVYTVLFYDYGKELISSGYCETNNTIFCGKRQWYTDWHIVIKNEDGEIVLICYQTELLMA